MSKKQAEPELPGLHTRPMKWQSVKVYSDDVGIWVEYEAYLLSKALSAEESARMFREAKLPALKEAREILDREIEKMESESTGG